MSNQRDGDSRQFVHFMKRNCPWVWCLTIALLSCAVEAAGQEPGAPNRTVVYSTGFEPEEGFDPMFTVVGQGGWVGFGEGVWNGLVTNFFEGFGQQAFIGFIPPTGTNQAFNLWRPLNLAPIDPNQPIVTFSVLMQIVPSTEENGRTDDFRWSVYNTNGSKLFTLDFDTSNHRISYALDDDASFVPTGFTFDDYVLYELIIGMDFSRNLWTAAMNGRVIANSLPITTSGLPLNLGDIDAVWAIRQPGAPGDNYMLFDDYTVVTEALTSVPPTVEIEPSEGRLRIRVYGHESLQYALEASSNLVEWQQLRTFTAPAGGIFEFEDPEASSLPFRFFRARHVP